MKLVRACIALLSFACTASVAASPLVSAPGAKASGFPPTITTLITTPLVIEGLTNDLQGNLYTPGRSTTPGQACPVWRVPIKSPSLTIVGLIPAPSATGNCSPSGLAFGPDGRLYVTQTDRIYRFTPNSSAPPTAELFASGIPGTNGMAFDRAGNLWTGDGTTGVGRVWRISTAGAVREMFRVQPMANEVNLAAGIGGIGRDVRSLGPGTITVTATSRNASNTLGSQPLVANGIMVTRNGNILVADTARGAIWLARIDRDGEVSSRMGCDTTFTANTLCMENVYVSHPLLEGADGIVLDVAGGIWVSANERNAVVYIYPNREVLEVYRSPVDPVTKLRNKGKLETPTSPILFDHKFCTANSDGNRRDNFPSTEGEIGGPNQDRGMISCIDQEVRIPGMDLPLE
ncbi:MAG TPA: SMP-30/gluconolactonase/LRE family protein [Usitatibacter sp.]|nr:SMP-30/gluconolactonase/LRE family protein [Usitatibacter sp.]